MKKFILGLILVLALFSTKSEAAIISQSGGGEANTNSETICVGDSVYLSGEGNCNTVASGATTEAAMETQLTDVSDLFTNNDGTLADDDLTDDTVDTLSDVTHTAIAANQVLIRNAGNTAYENKTLSGDVLVIASGVTTIQPNSVALTTDTTGNYVDDVTTSQGLLLTGTEGATVGLRDCAANEILKRNVGDTAWECSTDSTGGSPTFTDIATGTNTTATMTVGTGSTITTSGSGTIVATTSAALSANGGNCTAGSYPLGVDAAGAVESCTDATTEIDSAISTHTGNASAHHTATVETNSLETVTTGIATTEIPIGTGPDTVVYTALSGDLTMTNAGVVTVVDDSHNHVITNIDSFTKVQLETQTSDVADFAEADGDVFTGVHDFGGATSLETVNAAAPTVDAAGEFAIDTTADDFVYFGTAKRVLTFEKFGAFNLESPVDADNKLLLKAPYNLTLTDIFCIIDPADSAESVVIDLQERNSTGDSPVTVDATITCDNDGAEDDGALSNGTIDSGDWISIDIGTVTGTVDDLTVTFVFVKDSE